MTQFELMTVAMSLVLGLGVALLLTSALNVVRARDVSGMHWPTLGWSACIFVSQLQFWWAVGFLVDDVTAMGGLGFTLTILQAVCLFVAGGLILPSDRVDVADGLAAHFTRHGRYGVAGYVCYWIITLGSNVMVWGVSIFIPLHVTVLGMIGLGVAATIFVRRGATTLMVLAAVVLAANTLWPRVV